MSSSRSDQAPAAVSERPDPAFEDRIQDATDLLERIATDRCVLDGLSPADKLLR